MKKATLERREREREQHKNEILDAAERVFVQKGLSATVEMIANEAQFAVGSLYNFFSGKDEIFQQVLLRISRLGLETFQGLSLRMISSPVEGLRWLVVGRFAFHEKHGSFLHMARVENYLSGSRGFEGIEKERAANRKECERLLHCYFEALSKEPAARGISPDVMQDTFSGFLRMAYFRAVRDQGAGPEMMKALEAYCISALEALFLK